MLEDKLNEEEVKLAIELSMSPTKFDKYIILLKKDFGYNLSKTNLAKVLNKSEQTIDRRIKDCYGIPSYLKSGDGAKASYIFPVIEVAEFLCKTIKVH